MRRNFIAFIIAAAAVIGTDMLAGCHQYDEPETDLIRFESYEKQTVKNGDRIGLVLAPSVAEDSYVGIQAEVVSNSGTVTVIATKAVEANPWEIEVLNPEFGADGKVTKNPAIVIANAGEYRTDALLKVCLIDNDGQSHVVTKAISAGERPAADLIVYGKIFTSDNAESIVEAFAVKDGRYICVGGRDEVAEYADDDTKTVDYTGKGLVIPGCTEGHGHFVGIDGIVHQLPGFKASYDELVKTIIPQTIASKPGPFFSFGWNTAEIDKFSKRDYAMEIEAASSGYPVVLDDGGGHNALCNKAALKKAGIINDKGEKILDVRGGDIITVLDEDGNPTNIASGYITDEVVPFVIERAIGAILDESQYYSACLNAVDELNRRGYTNYLDAYINAMDAGDTYTYLTNMDKIGLLTVNIMGYFTIRSYDWGLPKGGAIPDNIYAKLNYVSYLNHMFTGGHINASGIKLFQDGVTDTATGWISGEYTLKELPEDKKHGNIIWEQEELNQIVAAANAKGFPVHTHTFGDMACHALIDAYAASPSAPGLKIHNSLAHVRNMSSGDIARCGVNHIDIASNMIWHAGVPDDIYRYMTSYIPKTIFDSGFPMKSLLDAGIVVSSSTDAPCGEELTGTVPNIIGVCVTGLNPDFPDVTPFNASELITVRQALKCLTVNGAANLGLEKERGSIEKGKYADFVVLDRDVLELEKTDKMGIFKTNVASTWFEGKEVFSAGDNQ